MSPLHVVVFLAFTTESALGFGATVVTVALGSLLLPLETILPAFVPLNVALSTYLAVRYRRDVELRLLFTRIVPLMALGMPVGFVALRALGGARLTPIFGALVVVLAVVELVRLARASRTTAGDDVPAATPTPTPRGELVSGALLLLAGIVHGAFATGGPLAVYVTGKRLADKARFRATLSALWLLLNAALVITYAATGTLDRATLRTSATLAVSLAAGTIAGELLHHRVPDRAFRLAVFVVLLLAGLILVVRR